MSKAQKKKYGVGRWRKKGLQEAGLYHILIGCLVVLVFFFGLFGFYASEAEHSLYRPSNASLFVNTSLTTQLGEINKTATDVRNSASQIGEIKSASGIFTTLEGLTSTLKLMLQAISLSFNTISIFLTGLGLPIPAWFVGIILTGIVIVGIVAFIKAVAGRNRI